MAKRPLTDEERYQRLADKRNKRAEQNHPLFAQAGLLHEVAHIWTAGDVKREIEGYAAKLERGRQETLQKAQQLRQEFGELAGPEELAKADAYRREWLERWGDMGPAYEADYWHGLLRDWRRRDMAIQIAAYGYRDACGQLVVVTDLYTEGERWAPSAYNERKGIWEVYPIAAMLSRPLDVKWHTQTKAQAELDRAAEAAGWRPADSGDPDRCWTRLEG